MRTRVRCHFGFGRGPATENGQPGMGGPAETKPRCTTHLTKHIYFSGVRSGRTYARAPAVLGGG